MLKLFNLKIVSLESEVFSGSIKKLFVTGIQGEMEILINHSPLLSFLAPGTIWVVDKDDKERGFLSYGGVLEVQPTSSTVLADTILREKDLDEKAALSVKDNLEKKLKTEKGKSYAQAKVDLANAVAQLRFLRKMRSRKFK